MNLDEEPLQIYMIQEIFKMAETLTEKERKKYIEELNKIAQKRYGKDYHGLCADRQAIVKRLHAANFPNL